MRKMVNRIGISLCFFVVLFAIGNNCFAGDLEECKETCSSYSNLTAKNECIKSCDARYEPDFWGAASTWFGKVKDNASGDSIEELEGVNEILDQFQDMIDVIGTTVITIITIILGIQFMFGSVEGKTNAKQGLITLLVACVFFFGWTSLKNLLYPGNNFILFSSNDMSIKAPAGRVWAYVKFFGNIIAFIVIVWVGLKYILTGASGKADLKNHSVQFIIGMIMTFATINFLSFISDTIIETLQ